MLISVFFSLLIFVQKKDSQKNNSKLTKKRQLNFMNKCFLID